MKVYKKKVILIVVSILLVLSFIFVYNIKQIKIECAVLLCEILYAETQSDEDLIDLVLVMEGSIRKKASIKYAKILLNDITEEGIKKSAFSSVYSELDFPPPPKDIAVQMYLRALLSAKEYETFIKEFSQLYPQTEHVSHTMLDVTIVGLYEQYKDIEIINAGISAYKIIIEQTNDELLKAECESQIRNLEEHRGNYNNTENVLETQWDGSSV